MLNRFKNLKKNKIIKVIAVTELLCGIFGVGYASYIFYSFLVSFISDNEITLYDSNALMFIFILPISFILFSLLATISGYLLLKEREWGVKLSRIVQLLQIPCFSVAQYVYYLGLGVIIFVVGYIVDKPGTILSFGFNMIFQFPAYWNVGEMEEKFNGFLIGINVIALLQFLYLCFSKKVKQLVNNS